MFVAAKALPTLTSNSPSFRWFPRCCCMNTWAEKLPPADPSPSCPSFPSCRPTPNANLGGRAGRAGGPALPPTPVVDTVGEPNVKANGGGPSSAEQVLWPGTPLPAAAAAGLEEGGCCPCFPPSGAPGSAAASAAAPLAAASDRFLTALFDTELRRPFPACGAREARCAAPSGVK